jgi:thiol-disulfide isomerase/thioredoxin
MNTHVARLALTLLPLFSTTAPAALAEEQEPPKLLGPCTVEQLEQPPYGEWFRKGYDDYAPNPDVVARLRSADTSGLRVEVFFGTWCGDSRRELPHLVKLLDTLGFPRERLALIGVDSTDELHKRSPGGEQRDLEIYRVPTFVVEREKSREVARIVEYPVVSLERDLLAIVEGRAYEPSYASYPVVRRWLGDGLLADPNVSARGLADEVRHVVSGEGELGAAARVMLHRGQTREAVKLLEINCALFRESPRSFTALAEALVRAGEPERAGEAAERALALGPDRDAAESLAAVIRKTTASE